MSFIDNLVRSKGYKNFMAKLYGWGAAVVIIGALFKINHWPGAVPMLILGMGTESVIFFLSAFEPPHVEWDWSLGSGLSVALMCFILITSFVFGNNDDADGGRMLW